MLDFHHLTCITHEHVIILNILFSPVWDLIFRPIPSVTNVWKGVLSSGKTGLFNPAHTVTYLGNNLPAANMPSDFIRGGKQRFFIIVISEPET